MKKNVFVVLTLVIFIQSAWSQSLKPASLFADHMVFQCNQPLPVWGTAAPQENITVTFGDQVKNTTADKDGKWMVKLAPLESSKVGRDMVISGKTQLIISDIVVGEVWICSGQSNMAMRIESVPEVKKLKPFANNIRSFEVKRTVALEEQEDVSGQWAVMEPESAVAFSFAFFLENISDVPIGIIHASWGSSSIEAWMPRDMTTRLPHFKTIMETFDADTSAQNRIKQILATPNGWSLEEDIYIRRQPNILYNAMMKPLAPFACQGLVWYQGERNTRYLSGMPEVTTENWYHQVAGMKEYGDVLKQWIMRYREQWQNEKMNFIVVMLPGFGGGTVEKKEIDPQDPTAHSWAWIRESQLKVHNKPGTTVINTIDLGDVKDIHPKDKLPIGKRLALMAAKNTLGQNILAEGPIMESIENKGNQLVVNFKNANGLKTVNRKPPTGFWLCDDTKVWKRADAKIEGEKVLLSSKEFDRPLYVRYAFSGKPEVNLVNEMDLPAYPFRTDNFND